MEFIDHCGRHAKHEDLCPDCWRITQESIEARDREKRATNLGSAGPRHRTPDYDTSIDAAESFTEERLSEIQGKVLGYFRKHGNATDRELEAEFNPEACCFGQSTIRKRRGELVDKGYVRESALPRRGGCAVWELVPR